MPQDIEQRLARLERLVIIGAKQALNTKDVAVLLDITTDRVRHLCKARAIPYYKQGNRNYFDKDEITRWQLQNRIPTNAELASQARTYCAINK